MNIPLGSRVSPKRLRISKGRRWHQEQDLLRGMVRVQNTRCDWCTSGNGLTRLSGSHPFHRIPDNCKVKAKMIYAASKETIRKSLQGIATEVQATDASEIAYEAGGFFLVLCGSLCTWPDLKLPAIAFLRDSPR